MPRAHLLPFSRLTPPAPSWNEMDSRSLQSLSRAASHDSGRAAALLAPRHYCFRPLDLYCHAGGLFSGLHAVALEISLGVGGRVADRSAAHRRRFLRVVGPWFARPARQIVAMAFRPSPVVHVCGTGDRLALLRTAIRGAAAGLFFRIAGPPPAGRFLGTWRRPQANFFPHYSSPGLAGPAYRAGAHLCAHTR